MRYSYQEDEVVLTADNLLTYKNKIWFTERDCNELYCLDLEQGYPKMVCKFDAEKVYQSRLFGGLIPLKEKLYAIPCAAEGMYEIDTAAGEMMRWRYKRLGILPGEKNMKYLDAE